MESFDTYGYFWIDVQPNEELTEDLLVPGELHFDDKHGCKLEVIGDFSGKLSPECTILGICEGIGEISLYKCSLYPQLNLTRVGEGFANLTKSVFSCEIACVGIHKAALNDVKLKSIRLAMHNLERWLGSEFKGLTELGEHSFNYKKPEDQSASMSNIDATIVISHDAKSASSRIASTASISLYSTIQMKFNEPIELRDAISWERRFQTLVALGINNATCVKNLWGKTTDGKGVALYYAAAKHRIAPNYEMTFISGFFNFEDIGGVSGMAQILSEDILDSLAEAMLPLFICNMPSEYSLFSVYKAAATLAAKIDNKFLRKEKLESKLGKSMAPYSYNEHIYHIIEPFEEQIIKVFFKKEKHLVDWVNNMKDLRDKLLAHTSVHKKIEEPLGIILFEYRIILLLLISMYIINTATTEPRYKSITGNNSIRNINIEKTNAKAKKLIEQIK